MENTQDRDNSEVSGNPIRGSISYLGFYKHDRGGSS